MESQVRNCASGSWFAALIPAAMSLTCSTTSSAQFAAVGIFIDANWSYSITGSGSIDNVQRVATGDTLARFTKVGGPSPCASSDPCPATFSEQVGPQTILETVDPLSLSLVQQAEAATVVNGTPCSLGFSTGCGGLGSTFPTAFATVGASLSQYSGGLDYRGAADAYTVLARCFNCEDPLDRYSHTQASFWCKGAQSMWYLTGSGTITLTGYLYSNINVTGGYPNSCIPNAGSLVKFGRSTYRVVIENDAGYYREFTLRLRVQAVAADGSPGQITWDNTIPADIIETTFTNGGRTNMSLEFVESGGVTGNTTCVTGEFRDGENPYFTTTIDYLVPAGQTHRWKVSLASESDILTPASDFVGTGSASTCLSLPGCDIVGEDPDGIIDISDLKALARAVGSTTTQCGYIDTVDWDNDGIVEGGEIEPFVCNIMAEINGDGFLDFFDYDAFIEAFEAGNGCIADLNVDGSIDFFDYDLYVVAFESRDCIADATTTPVCQGL
jgi:hypothetical protein